MHATSESAAWLLAVRLSACARDSRVSPYCVQVIAFLNAHPTELAMLNVWDCQGSGCMASVEAEARAAGAAVVDDCAHLAGLTLGEAKVLGKLSGGGALLVFTGGGGPNAAACATTHYDGSLECVSVLAEQEEAAAPLFRGCWTSDKDHGAKITSMLKQLDSFIHSGLSNKSFWQAQALWQEGADTVVIGTLRNSSLLKDEQESQLNAALAKEVLAGRWPQLGLIEVNNVCNGGPALLDAIRHTYYDNVAPPPPP
jgi:hypothetical protein